MAITVNLNGGQVKLGGKFHSALEFVKFINGRSWEPETKSRTINMPIDDFVKLVRGRFPVDVSGGRFTGHITKYGNGYTHNEWSAKAQAERAEAKVREGFAPKFAALDLELQTKADAHKINPKAVSYIHSFQFAEMVENGRIQFITESRKAEVMSLVDWYEKEKLVLYEDEDDAIHFAAKQVYETFGVF